MHKYYEEHFLYNYNPEQINSVCCWTDDDYVTFNIGKPTYIECGDCKTAQLVYIDICKRLKESGKFINARSHLINISNVEDIELKHYQSSNHYIVVVLFKGKGGNAIPCDNCVDAHNMYNYLTEKLNSYKVKNHMQVANLEKTINK